MAGPENTEVDPCSTSPAGLQRTKVKPPLNAVLALSCEMRGIRTHGLNPDTCISIHFQFEQRSKLRTSLFEISKQLQTYEPSHKTLACSCFCCFQTLAIQPLAGVVLGRSWDLSSHVCFIQHMMYTVWAPPNKCQCRTLILFLPCVPS